ncbi:unnamed protein product [Meganyctiphanes norvegica]|uniref:Uncharacterized protein n=1 Tax=Meganyctiphanes norvegica TaxID=48144 RepID=A0AAV2QJN2_MEGNR
MVVWCDCFVYDESRFTGMKIMKLDKKTLCGKRENAISILQQRKQVINDFIIVIQEEIATIVTRNQMKYAKKYQIPPDENCEDCKSLDYKARPVISVTHSYENATEEDMVEWIEIFETPKVTMCNIDYVINPENNSKSAYKEIVKMIMATQLQCSCEPQDVPLLRQALHRKTAKKNQDNCVTSSTQNCLTSSTQNCLTSSTQNCVTSGTQNCVTSGTKNCVTSLFKPASRIYNARCRKYRDRMDDFLLSLTIKKKKKKFVKKKVFKRRNDIICGKTPPSSRTSKYPHRDNIVHTNYDKRNARKNQRYTSTPPCPGL